MRPDVLIMGAGLSGLACAVTLKKAGIHSQIIDSNKQVGGRVFSHRNQAGFVIDKGFQVLLNSYPELDHFIDLSKLDLQYFNSGALVFDGHDLSLLANPLVHPKDLLSSLKLDLMSLKDKALILKLILAAQLQRSDSPLGQTSTLAYLQDFGFSSKFIEVFWRPFLSGVFLDNELGIGDGFFKFLIRCFGAGKVTIPAQGMAELPLQMASQLPKDSFLLGRTARSWSSNEVILENGEKLQAKRVVCAFDPNANSKAPSHANRSYRSVETFYFTSSRLNEVNWGKWLVLVPQNLGYGINHFILLSEVAKTYTQSTPLLSVSVIGNKHLELPQVLQELNQIAKMDLNLELVDRVFVKAALPQWIEDGDGFKVINDIVHCGDCWASPSINGALRSGRMAAQSLLKDFASK